MNRVGSRAFTIVELLIVIVVIAILAAITIVAYNGIQSRARTASVQADTSNALKKIKVFQTENASEAYPTSVSSCPTPATGTLCLSGSGGNTIDYFVDNSASPASYCLSSSRSTGEGYFVDDAGQVLPGSCVMKSCYDIQQKGGSHGSGFYWIKPTTADAQRVYCDMQTAGGGWTLLVTNAGAGTHWDSTTVRSYNEATPSISQSYSILNKANNIKANLGNKLNYRIDANTFGTWGGIWEAPYSNSFVATAAANNSTNIQKFGSWTIDTDSSNASQALTNNMPWLSSAPQLLSTWFGSGNWFGSLVTNQTGWNTAPYITPELTAPTIVWYWVK